MTRISRLFAPILCVALVWACGGSETTTTAALTETAPPYPADNPPSTAKVELGRLLFWDPILSGTRDVACASCHHPDFAYTDGRAVSVGVGGVGLGPSRATGPSPHRTTRNAMTVLDAAWNGQVDATVPSAADAPMFWDDRARSLEAQAKGPLGTMNEMCGESFDASTIFPEIVARLLAIPEYETRFGAAFDDGVTEENVVRAIATFERTLVDHGSSYDRYVRGDTSALSAAQQNGLQQFERSGCTGCHSGPMFSDFEPHRIAARRGRQNRVQDPGVGGGTFRTASLRNVMRTAPYMHDGALETIDDVLDLYRNVDEDSDPKLRAVNVPNGGDRRDLEAFLRALSDGTFDQTIPTEVPSGLSVGGNLGN